LKKPFLDEIQVSWLSFGNKPSGFLRALSMGIFRQTLNPIHSRRFE
jgi:hypothetical protein